MKPGVCSMIDVEDGMDFVFYLYCNIGLDLILYIVNDPSEVV